MTAMTDQDLPPLYHGADATSVRAQRQYLHATGWRLAMAVLAAVFGALAALEHGHGLDPYGLAAAAAFTAALVIEVWLLQDRPEDDWYEGRACAESARTLVWRYAVGGEPFPIGRTDADGALTELLADLLDEFDHLPLAPARQGPASEIPRTLRNSDLEVRRAAYITDRVRSQQEWYAGKAEFNRRRATLWGQGLIVIEVIGVAVGLLTAFGTITLDFLSIISTAVGCGVAWLAVRQHQSLRLAYSNASHDLAFAAEYLTSVTDEAGWAEAVGVAEEAISREHTMWRLARGISIRPAPRIRRQASKPRSRPRPTT